ncbi:MAG: ammonium transporter [Acidimicrobiales bacterium]
MQEAEALDVLWVLLSATLVMLMQVGFSALESGLVRSKNSINVAAKNFTDFLVSAAVFWLFGFALMFGLSGNAALGWGSFAFDMGDGDFNGVFFLFQLGFAGTAATIVSGAVAERMRFGGYIVMTLLMAVVIYPIFGHWAWGGIGGGPQGWLEDLGFVDFAGSTVVHSVGGWAALAAIIVLGPRLGRFGAAAVPIRGHNLPLVTVGVFVLWVGWFGFNGGSTLAFNEDVPGIVVNTMMAAVFGGLAALAATWLGDSQPDVTVTMNGALAGLVAITASAHAVSTAEAAVIGIIGAACMVMLTALLVRFEIDDAVGAVPVHLGAGIWGTLAVAFFANLDVLDTGLSRVEQIGAQLLGIAVAAAWTFGIAFGVLRMLNGRLLEFRIDPEGERVGLNVAEHGASTEILDLLNDMDEQARSGDYATPVRVEPNTEVGQIARQYNVVLDGINSETRRREAAVVALEQQTASLALLESIATATNQAETLTETMETALQQICKFTGWPVGHFYRVNQATNSLMPTRTWWITDPDRFSDFQGLTDAQSFAPGEGLPGMVLRSGRPETLRFAVADARFPRSSAAVDAGINAGFAFPVVTGPDVVGVLEFFSEEADELDSELLDLMAVVGTQLGRAFERRLSNEERFRAVVDNMPAMVLLRDTEGRFVFVNRGYEEYYGLPAEEIVGSTLQDLERKRDSSLRDATPDLSGDQHVLETGEVTEYEIEFENGDVLSSVKFPIVNHVGRIVAVGGVEIDITDRKRHAAELADLVEKVESARDQALDATQAKSQFLANMSHELRTPLNAIIGFTRIVRRKAAPGMEQTQAENVDRILESAEGLLVLINEILDLSRVEAGRLDVDANSFDPGGLAVGVAQTLAPVAHDKGITIEAEVSAAPKEVFQDDEKLRQILMNLVGNAVKFTEVGSVTVLVGAEGQTLVFTVEDTGPGIKRDALGAIFDEFTQADQSTTRRYGGTGLGLAISAKLARLLGGSIEVSSEVGTGSVFRLMVPLRYEEPPPPNINGDNQ